MTQEVQVDYSRTVAAHAKVKRVNQAGIHFYRYDYQDGRPAVVAISCVNKKDGSLTSGLELQIPIEDVDKVIEALKQFR